MSGDPAWIYWAAGAAAAVILIYLIVILFNADRLH